MTVKNSQARPLSPSLFALSSFASSQQRSCACRNSQASTKPFQAFSSLFKPFQAFSSLFKPFQAPSILPVQTSSPKQHNSRVQNPARQCRDNGAVDANASELLFRARINETIEPRRIVTGQRHLDGIPGETLLSLRDGNQK